MMILPLLPIGRQLKSTCQQIFAGLRATARSLRLLDNTLPRLRLRSLDIIPLSLSLPRNISIMELTRQLDPSASLDVWLQLEFGSTFASEIFRRLIPFFASSSDSSPPTLPPLMTWNPSSLAAIHSQPSPKINHILKLAKSHICFVQETRWTSVQFNYLLGRAPFCHIAHTPATSTGSSGVATFFPRRITPTSSTTIAPGFILSSKCSLQGYQCEVLNVYLHPDKVHSLASILLKHLKSADSRKNVVRIVGGDFNKLPSRAPDLFNSILVELDCSSPPMQNSYRQHNGYQAPLDFFLLQTPANFHQLLSSSKRFTFWPKYQPVGHGIHICKFPRITPITSSSDDLPAPTIPTSAFYLPPSSQIITNSHSASNLQPLIRSLLSLSSPSLLSVKAAIWSWWRHSSRTNKPLSPSHHYNLLQRKIRDPKSLQCILPRLSWEWLLSHFPSASSSYPIVHDAFVSVPIILLSRLLTQYDVLFSSTDRPIPRSQFSTPPTHTWHKCRNAAPKITRHTGIIRSDTGDVCKTTADLDRALRATRFFWQDYPCPYDPSWSSLIQDYAASSTPFSLCRPPTYDDFYYAIVTSPDSAPGADGIPYAAWRVCPSVSTTSLAHHFQNILYRKVSPPTQALVFIPKADQGEYADNYRPLGLPNTCDRIVDRAAYTLFCQSLIGNLHPAQALLNLFREPQGNYLAVQHFLDSEDNTHCVLLSDLAKAFERVNPHWIIHVLAARGVAFWIISYCRHILFGRKVLHKIGSTFRPSLPINIGVDMGRAFSVLLFCIAMDPWYHHVNRIPDVIVNKGYMDDNATGGIGLSWVYSAEKLLQSMATAGFLVLSHTCYQVESVVIPVPPAPIFSSMDFVTQGHHSLLTALCHPLVAPVVRLRCGNRAVTLPSHLLLIGDTLECPSHPLLLAYLHTAECKCKCKTFLLSNSALSPTQLEFLDSTPFGVKIVKPNATMLGLHLHSPHLSVTQRFSLQGDLLSPLPHVTRSHVDLAQLNTAVSRMLQRVRAGTNLGLSFRERTLFLSFYVLSLPHYHHSNLLPSSNYVAHYYRLIRQHLCKRAWIQAKHLPGVVTYLKLGILHCPKIFLLSSLLGLCIRLYGLDIVLWLCRLTPSLPFLPKRILEGLYSIRAETTAADSFNKEPFSHQLHRFLSDSLPPYTLSRLVTRTFKSHVLPMLHADTRSFLRLRISQVDWRGDSSSTTLDMLHTTPIKVIPPFARLAILRWSIDSEPDLHFRLRPHFTRRTSCRCGCGQSSSLYPEGFRAGAVAADHLLNSNQWTIISKTFSPSCFDRFCDRYPHPPLPAATSPIWCPRKGAPLHSLDHLDPTLRSWIDLPCVLCGQGDNSVQHWLRFCPVPALVGSALLNRPWRTYDWSLGPTFSASKLAMIGALWVGTRQFVHERSGLPPPSLASPSFIFDDPIRTTQHLLDRVYSLIPLAFRPAHIAPLSPPPIIQGCFRNYVHSRLLTLEREGFPIYYGHTHVTSHAVAAQSTLAVFPPTSSLLRTLHKFQSLVSRPPNCYIQFKLCACGSVHGHLISLTDLDAGTPLYVGDPPVDHLDFVIQFDGGAFREHRVGGAGIVLWKHTTQGLTLLDTFAVPLFPCPDAAYAETVGAAHAVLMAARHFPLHRPSRILIKGDNRPIIDFMNSVGKLRRPDLQKLLTEAQHALAFSLPPLIWSYTPREFNKCADFLAGIARDYAKQSLTPDLLPYSLSPFVFPLPPSLSPLYSPPPPLTLSPPSSAFTFQGSPDFPISVFPQLARKAAQFPPLQRYLRALQKCPSSIPTISVLYRPTADDQRGRLYPLALGASKLSRHYRALLFGRSHTEIDITGSQYQFFQRFASSLLGISLPSIDQLRHLLKEDFIASNSRFLVHHPTSPKDLPTILLNSSLEATLLHYRGKGYWPSQPIREILHQISNQTPPPCGP